METWNGLKVTEGWGDNGGQMGEGLTKNIQERPMDMDNGVGPHRGVGDEWAKEDKVGKLGQL